MSHPHPTPVLSRLAVTLPEAEHRGVRVRRFDVRADDPTNAHLHLEGRGCEPGTYTRIDKGGVLWMSDTTAERRDHLEPLLHIARPETRRVLINGLGLGMIVQGALSFAHVEHIDVVERDTDIIALVGPHYEASGRVTIHHHDALTKAWPEGTRWDVGWSDIWPTLNPDDLAEHALMNQRYGLLCGWHGCWAHQHLVEERRRRSARGWAW